MTQLPTVVVVGLGPAGADLLPAAALAAIVRVPVRFLRTERHPAASAVAGAATFDEVYEVAPRLDDVYPEIMERLVASAREHGEVLYAVPGSPVVAERTVELLVADERVAVELVPAMSFLDLAWVRLGVDPVALGVRVVDGHRFESEAAGERGPLLVAQCDSELVLGDVKLALSDAIDRAGDLGGGLARLAAAPDGTDVPGAGFVPDDLEVTVLQRLGLPDESITTVPWHELDRIEADHLTSLWIPELAAPVAGAVQRFAELVATLRAECPWDRDQTHDSLRRHLVEEAYEVLDAIDGVDPDEGTGYEHLEEELGDLLFQVLFHSTLAAEAGQFTLADVATTIHDKLRARHPHVFGEASASSAEEVAADWEQRKKAEKGRDSVFDGIPEALPSLLYALKIQKKAASLAGGSLSRVASGDGSDGGPSEGGELRAPDEGARAMPAVPDLDDALDRAAATPTVDTLGDLLLAVVDLARRAGVDPETALRSRAAAWQARARAAEQRSQVQPG